MDFNMNFSLNKKQISEYNKNGYLVINNVIEPKVIDKLKNEIKKLVEESRNIKKSDHIYDLAESHSKKNLKVRRIKQPQNINSKFKYFLKNKQIIDKVSSLIGKNIRLHGGKINLKSPSAGDPVDWHQDWAFYPHTNDNVLAVGVMLDDMTLDNGTVLFIPESHKKEIYNHHKDGFFAGAIDVNKENVDTNAAIKVTGKAGSITIHHARLVHASKPNHSNTMRRFLLWEFAATDAWPLMGFDGYESFNKKIITGKSINTPRLENVPVRIPLPPAVFQGSIFENQRIIKNKNL